MVRNILFGLFSLMVLSLNAQNKFFEAQEKVIASLSKQIYESENDKEKINLNDDLLDALYALVSNKKSLRYKFTKLDHISIVKPKDGEFRMFTWSIKLGNNNFVYSGLFHYYDKKQRAQVIHVLKDYSSQIKEPEGKTLRPDYWYGALYYNVITKEYNGVKYFTLLGLDGHDDRSNKKIIDLLWFDRKMTPYFGAPAFVSERGIKNRFILEYNELSSVKLNYQSKLNLIYFDHLEPVDGVSYNVLSSYVPTSDVDGFIFKKGKWSLVKQIDVEKLK